MHQNSMGRREFLQSGGAAAAGLAFAAGTLASTKRAHSANERITVGVMGVHGRGRFHAEYLSTRSDVNIAYLCDADANVLESCGQSVEKLTGKKPKLVGDFRRILDDKSVDALFVATPDHWHALPTIYACQAGKDVYVEKPASHNIFEGQKMVEASRKYNRIVQLGTQTRSGAYTLKAKEYIQSGALGDIHFVRVIDMKQSGNIGHKPDGEAPKGVDYDMWLGPAPKRAFNPNHFHGGWYWLWTYSGGNIINDTIHQIDIARYLIGKDYPKSVTATGGKFAFDDDQETPDTLTANAVFDGTMMTVESLLYTPYQKKVIDKDRESTTFFPDWRFCGERIEIYGTKNQMFFGRHGIGWQVYDADGKVISDGNGPIPLAEHVDNFFACIKDRKRPTADIQEGHRSTIISELANISYRLGGRKIEFDGRKEQIVNDDEAAKMTRRTYREPWVVKDSV